MHILFEHAQNFLLKKKKNLHLHPWGLNVFYLGKTKWQNKYTNIDKQIFQNCNSFRFTKKLTTCDQLNKCLLITG